MKLLISALTKYLAGHGLHQYQVLKTFLKCCLLVSTMCLKWSLKTGTYNAYINRLDQPLVDQIEYVKKELNI